MDNEYKSVTIFMMVISAFMIIFMMVLLFIDGTISIHYMDCINIHDNGCFNSWRVFYYHILVHDYSYYHGNMMMDIHMDNNMNINEYHIGYE